MKTKILIFASLLLIVVSSCKKDNNNGDDIPIPTDTTPAIDSTTIVDTICTDTTICYDIPIVVDDSTVEFNVLFYGDFCVECPYAHYNLYVDSVFMGRIYGCYAEGECRCDSNPDGLHAIIAPGIHTYTAIPLCGWIENGEVVDEPEPAGNRHIEENFEVPVGNCISVYVSY